MAENKNPEPKNGKYPISETIAGGTDVETVYLEDSEINSFLEKYLKENPNTEVETRYVNRTPVTFTQEIQVRWLRPETPQEPPPIIIREVPEPPVEQKPLKIVQVRKNEKEEELEPIIIREKPPIIAAPEPKVIYAPRISETKQTSPINGRTERKLKNSSSSSSSTKGLGQRSKSQSHRAGSKLINYYDGGDADLAYYTNRLNVNETPTRNTPSGYYTENNVSTNTRASGYTTTTYTNGQPSFNGFDPSYNGYPQTSYYQMPPTQMYDVDYNNLNNYKVQSARNSRTNLNKYFYEPNQAYYSQAENANRSRYY